MTKKYKTTSEYKIRNKKRQEFQNKRRGRFKEIQKKRNASQSYGQPYHSDTHVKTKTIKCPRIFCIEDNSDQALSIFKYMNKYCKKKRRVFLDLEDVEKIGYDVILYLLSQFAYYKKVHRFYDISGNRPKAAAPRRRLDSSGFYKYVKQRYVIESDSSNSITIQSGQYADNGVADEAYKWVTSRKKIHEDSLQAAFATIMECMGNTAEWAYSDRDEYPRWWLFVHHETLTDEIQFYFLDNGKGIPRTVTKRLGDTGQKHSSLIHSTLKGIAMRTSSGDSFRGRGLYEMYEAAMAGRMRKFKVLSGKGFVDVESGIQTDNSWEFRGTMLKWTC